MPRISIDLSPDDFAFVETEIVEASLGSASELVRIALAEYRRGRALDEVDRLVEEALESGEPIPVTPEYWERKKRQFLEGRRTAIQ
jgi:Arc/MetJ-type ribon-helix-helix transcriptional regulator